MEYYSESWVYYHIKQLVALGYSESDVLKSTKLTYLREIESPKHNEYISLESTSAVFNLLRDSDYYISHELPALDESLDGGHFHNVYLFNSANIDVLIARFSSIARIYYSDITFDFKYFAGELYIFIDAKKEGLYFSIQGVVYFLYRVLCHVFGRDSVKKNLLISIADAKIPAADLFFSSVTDCIRYKSDRSFLKFKIQNSKFKMII